MEARIRDDAGPAALAGRPVAVVRLARREEHGHGGRLRDEDEDDGGAENRQLPGVVADPPARAGLAASLAHPVADDMLARPRERRDDDADPLHERELPQGEPANALALRGRKERLAPGRDDVAGFAHIVALRRTPMTI